MRQIILVIFLLFLFSCSYLQGPAGEDLVPRNKKQPYYLRVEGVEPQSDGVYYINNNLFMIKWQVDDTSDYLYSEVDKNGDGIVDETTTNPNTKIVNIPEPSEGMYNIAVRSFFKNFTSNWTNYVKVLIDKTPPISPVSVNCSSMSSGNLTISWNQTQDISSSIPAGLAFDSVFVANISTSSGALVLVGLDPYTGKPYRDYDYLIITDPFVGNKIFYGISSYYDYFSNVYTISGTVPPGDYNIKFKVHDRSGNETVELVCSVNVP